MRADRTPHPARRRQTATRPPEARPWHGPAPDRGQRRLLRACLAPVHEAEQAWNRWRLSCDLDREPPATLELAALAVLRLGERAGHGAIVGRCRGVHRRAWLISQGCLDAARDLARSAGGRGDRVLATGDLAMAWIGPRFAGHPFPVRMLRLGTTVVDPQQEQGWELASLGALGRGVREAGLLRLERAAVPDWIVAGASPVSGSFEGLDVPPLAVLLADQVRRNWRWSPPDGLRWILELVLAMRQHPRPEELAAAIIGAAHRLDALAELEAAARLIDRLSCGPALQLLRQQLRREPISLRERLAVQVRASPPGSALHTVVAFRQAWRRWTREQPGTPALQPHRSADSQRTPSDGDGSTGPS